MYEKKTFTYKVWCWNNKLFRELMFIRDTVTNRAMHSNVEIRQQDITESDTDSYLSPTSPQLPLPPPPPPSKKRNCSGSKSKNQGDELDAAVSTAF